MTERFKKLKERMTGKRGSWERSTVTPKRIHDQIHRKPTEADYPPTEADKRIKEDGIVRTTKRRNR